MRKAERAALFKQQNQAKIDAQKAAKEKERNIKLICKINEVYYIF
jgi:hypothetical protein